MSRQFITLSTFIINYITVNIYNLKVLTRIYYIFCYYIYLNRYVITMFFLLRVLEIIKKENNV